MIHPAAGAWAGEIRSNARNPVIRPHQKDFLVREIRESELGTEQKCVRCLEWWPLDNEFWYQDRDYFGNKVWRTLCRACFCQHQLDKRNHERDERASR